MKKLLAILIAGAFATSAFAADASAPMMNAKPADMAKASTMSNASSTKHSKKHNKKHHKSHKSASAA